MVGGTIRRKLIHRESFRASVLHLSEHQAVLESIAAKKCLLTTPSFLSSTTRPFDGSNCGNLCGDHRDFRFCAGGFPRFRE
jgi:hypothetical protein